MEALDLRVVRGGVLINGEEALVGVEGKMTGVVVGEVIRRVAVADDEKLDEAEERACVAVARIELVIDDLLDRPAWVDAERLQFDLRDDRPY